LCGRGFEHKDARPAPYFPFCSARCRAVDLGNWVTESYRVEGPEGAPEIDDGHTAVEDDESDEDE
jgi:endogenous inhibitor of DNA gyrase (YacG/DUF329 family)